nr:uncharacterized protein LOC129385090 [Dermacentor andersoni]
MALTEQSSRGTFRIWRALAHPTTVTLTELREQPTGGAGVVRRRTRPDTSRTSPPGNSCGCCQLTQASPQVSPRRVHCMDGWTLSDPAGVTAATTTIVRPCVESRMAPVRRDAASLSESDDDAQLDATLEGEADGHVIDGFLRSRGAHFPAKTCLQCSTSPRAPEANVTELAGASR